MRCFSLNGRVKTPEFPSSSDKQKPHITVVMIPNTRGNLFLKEILFFTPLGVGRKHSLIDADKCNVNGKIAELKMTASTYHCQWESAEHHFLARICFHRDFKFENILSPVWCRSNF